MFSTPVDGARPHVLCQTILVLFLLIMFAAVDAQAGYLYVLNDDSAGSRIYGFSVDETTGALTPLSGFPVVPGSGGIGSIVSERMVADTANYRLYVLNDGSDSFSAYNIDPATGGLSPMPFSPISLGTGTWNTVRVHPSGSPLIVTNGASGGGSMSFKISSSGAVLAAGSPFPLGGVSAFSSIFSHDGNYFYTGGNTGTAIAGFSVDTATGILTTLAGSPFPAGAANPIAYAVDPEGRLFTMHSTDTLAAFTSSAGVLTGVAGNPFLSGMSQRRYGVYHPAGFYMIAGNTGNNVGVFRIEGSGSATTLTPVSGSPFATGATTANVLALTASGGHLYVGNRISRSVTTFAVDGGTGQLTNLGSQPSNTLGTVGAINGMAYVPDSVANANISGHVAGITATADNTLITLSSDDNSILLSTRANNFGRYRFASLPTGKTYTVTAIRKGTVFTPAERVIVLSGNVSNADFAIASK
jgi:6-phosphogluconolactonase